jgi:hypothetical protein
MDKKNLNMFINLLQKVQKQPMKTFDLGLIVKEPKSITSVEEVFEEIKKMVPLERIIYNEAVTDEETVDKIIETFEKNNWILLEINKDVGSFLLNQLKHLANYNSLQILDYKEKGIFEMKMPKNSRVVVFAERDFIENKISYPHFYLLFGPTLSIK